MDALKIAFSQHSRHWRDNTYVYPVISRRSKGLSIGVNLNPDAACNFDCVYCCVDRTQPPRVRTVNLSIVESELRALLALGDTLFDDPQFSSVPPNFRRLNDIAFSGDGEPTTCPQFHDAVRLVARLRTEFGLNETRVVLITDACYLTRPTVVEALRTLDESNGQIWAKLDAGTEEYFRRVNRPNYPLTHVLANILAAARVRPIVIQSLFLRLAGESPPEAEISAYVGRLAELLDQGAQIALVQVYTVARRTADAACSALPPDELEQIAERVRDVGIPAESFP